MVLKYQSGEEIRKADGVLYHGEPATIEFIATELGDPETDWFVQEYGGGVMIVGGAGGRTFIPADQVPNDDCLEFTARAES